MISDLPVVKASAASWVFAHPQRETLCVLGSERLSWLNGVVTCDVLGLSLGSGAFGLALNRTGKVQSDLWLLSNSGQVFLAAAAGTREGLLQELGRMLIMEDAEITAGPALHWFTAHGPGAQAFVAALVAQGGVDAYGKVALVTEGDWLFACTTVAAQALTQARVSELHPAVTLGSEAEWQALRIEGGLPLFGVDYDARANPHDASLERRAVSWTKGCYLGQEVVCMQDMRGKPKRRLLPLGVEGENSVAVDTAVTGEAGQAVGAVTSAAFSRRLGHAVVMARLAAEDADAHSTPLFVGGKSAQRIAPGG